MANPTWSRDELLVTLDFYLRHTPSIPSKTSKEVIDLSKLLNQLRTKTGVDGDEDFRNPNGVYLKLMNLRRFDPDYKGKGMERGGKDEEVVWNLYANKRDELHKLANTISAFVVSDEAPPQNATTTLGDEEGDEGRILTRTHQYRERDHRLIAKKKDQVHKAHGHLTCEVCGFNFSKTYGSRGDGFIECHHTKPVSELKPNEKTKVSELALVCSNCHRMIHRQKPWLSIDALKTLLMNKM